MNTLTTTTQANTETMTSTELLAVINKYRLEDGKNEMRHDNFMAKIEDELEGDALKFQVVYLGGNNEQRKGYNLPKEECFLMAMRESKSVRRNTVDYIKQLETAKPVITLPSRTEAIQLSLELSQKVDDLEALAQRKAIGSTRVGKLATKFKEAYPAASWISSRSMNQILTEADLQIQVDGGYAITEAGRAYGTNTSQHTTQPAVTWSTSVFEDEYFQTVCEEFHKRLS